MRRRRRPETGPPTGKGCEFTGGAGDRTTTHPHRGRRFGYRSGCSTRH